MTSKERIQRTLRFQKTDRVPFNFWMDRDMMAEYEERLGKDFRINYYGADVLEVFPRLQWPTLKGEVYRDSVWYRRPLLNSIFEADKLELPDPTDDSVYESIKEDIANHPDTGIFVDLVGVLTIMHSLRFYEGFFLDIYDAPRKLHRFLDRISNILEEVARRVCELDIDVLYVMDDIGGKNGLMMSLPQLEEFVFQYDYRPAKIAQERGIPVLFHSDGDIMDALDKLIEMGIDGVNPLQPHLNDIKKFKAQHSDKLVVYGALDNTYIIPEGSPDQIRKHVLDTFTILGKRGGLILSTHDIPYATPEKNIEVMVRTIKTECIYGAEEIKNSFS